MFDFLLHDDGDPTAPITGWTRARWAALADGMLAAARQFATPGHGRIQMPDIVGGYGFAVDGLEGFTRTLMLAGFRLKGENGADPHGLAEFYARGIASGVDPDSPEAERWPRMTEHGQAKVEAATTALILDMTRPWIWDRLSPRTQDQVVDYFSDCIGDENWPLNNWAWFKIVIETFLKSVGADYSRTDITDSLALLDSMIQGNNGWITDGLQRNYDHYVGWAMHLYPILWARMQGAEEFAAPREARDRELLDAFLRDAIKLVGADGGPLIQGRSLVYRFATAAPYWVGALAEVPSTPLGQLRRAASGILDYFVRREGVFNEHGLLSLGYHQEWLPMLQRYSGTGSPYWASKGMLGLALPADHPVWVSEELPLPLELRDQVDVFPEPVWLVSGTKDDGIVRIINHGSDHADAGDRTGDSPLYARLGYSTATFPWVDDASWRQPTDQSVALVDADERVTHRTGWRSIAPVRIDDDVVVAGSVVDAHFVDMLPVQVHPGYGWHGRPTTAGPLTVYSVVRGPWEVRLVHIDSLTDAEPGALTLRVSGWPTVSGDGLVSTMTSLLGDGTASTLTRPQVTPFGNHRGIIPVLEYPAVAGQWYAQLVTLSGVEVAADSAPAVALTGPESSKDSGTTTARITWPDGRLTEFKLPGQT